VKDRIPYYYYPQVQMQMHATRASRAFFVIWTPIITSVFEVKRDDEIMQYLVQTVDSFASSLQLEEPPTVVPAHCGAFQQFCKDQVSAIIPTFHMSYCEKK
jgi:hypothetical protein